MQEPQVEHFYDLVPQDGLPGGAEAPRALLELALAVNKGKSIEEIVAGLYDSLGHIIPYDRMGVAFEVTAGCLELTILRSAKPESWAENSRYDLGASGMEPVIRHRKVRIVKDLAAFARTHPTALPSRLMAEEGMRSSIELPLCKGGEIVGMLVLASRAAAAYGAEQIDFLGTISASLGTAFERAMFVDGLRQATLALLEIDRLKTDILSNLSHELRTPLAQVLAYAYSLEDLIEGPLTLGQSTEVRQILQGAERLKGMLNDLFDVVALSSGMARINVQTLDLASLAREVFDEQEPELLAAGLEPSFSAEPGEPLILGDPPYLARAIRALVSNARKFTPAPGHVTVQVGGDPEHVWLEVADTGIGLAPEDQARVFDRFFQVEGGPARQRGGTGIQLALTKLIIEAHGGRIDLWSEPGSGSRFRISLKRAPEP